MTARHSHVTSELFVSTLLVVSIVYVKVVILDPVFGVEVRNSGC